MVQPNAIPAPPRQPAWDITFTRLTRAVQARVEACASDLARRFHAIGLGSDMQVRQTPRGLSTFLALVGQRGLICIVDLTLVDGMVAGKGPCATLDIRLLDGCGDAVVDGLGSGLVGRTFCEASGAEALSAEKLEQAATAVLLATFGQFDLLRPVACAGDAPADLN